MNQERRMQGDEVINPKNLVDWTTHSGSNPQTVTAGQRNELGVIFYRNQIKLYIAKIRNVIAKIYR